MASKRQKLKLSKRSATSESNDTKLDTSTSTKSFNETSFNNDGDSSFTSNGRQSDIFKKLRQQLQDIHTDVQPVQFSTFPIFKVNNIECSHKETLNNYEAKWIPFPELCCHCATGVHSGVTEQLNDGYSGTKASLQYEACGFSQLISHFHQEHLNRNQLNWIGKTSNLCPGTPRQHSLVDESKLDCMLSPDLFTCQSSVERRPSVNRETSEKSVVKKTLFPLHNAQDSDLQGEDSHHSVTSLIKQCPICQEVFTPQMKLRARNIHIESCLDVSSGDIWEAEDL